MAAIYRHGLPPSVGALCALLEEQTETLAWRRYMAAAAWRRDRLLGGKGFPSFEDCITPKRAYTEEEVALNRKRLLSGLRGEVTP